jgi:sugar (pentulose or hexulose) kinase
VTGLTPGHGQALPADAIRTAQTGLGIELGSTRVKAVLTGPDHRVLAEGGFNWENQFEDGRWTYPVDLIWHALASAYADLAGDVRQRYGLELERVGGIGISAMMHGYLAFGADGQSLVPFRTWRNTNTGPAAAALSRRLGINLPLRWSLAHLYQALLDGEPHVSELNSITTLAGYVHRRLTGQRVIGVGDASGMAPLASAYGVSPDDGLPEVGPFLGPGQAGGNVSGPRPAAPPSWDGAALNAFDELAKAAAGAAGRPRTPPLVALLPRPVLAGARAGRLTEAGAALLDRSGKLEPGAPLCPPEGDAGTGMVATGSVAPRSGNVSVGTSVFAMVVLERALAQPYPEIDLVATPDGRPVAMVHCNNGASELGAWCGLFSEVVAAVGQPVTEASLYASLFAAALDGDPAAGGLTAVNYLSGEPITHLAEGRPLLLRQPGSQLTLPDFMRAQLFTVFATLRLGMDVLTAEQVKLDRMFAHGGVFRTARVAQRFLAAALGVPVTVGPVADQGGAWGAAVLSWFARQRAGRSLAQYLEESVLAGASLSTSEPDPADVTGFEAYLGRFKAALPAVQAATAVI